MALLSRAMQTEIILTLPKVPSPRAELFRKHQFPLDAEGNSRGQLIPKCNKTLLQRQYTWKLNKMFLQIEAQLLIS